jgi:DNA (cytosine-5)-methyltransferase 3A
MSAVAKAQMTEIMGVEPIMIDAALVSGQRRKRLFWTNIPNVVLPDDRGIYLRDVIEQSVDDKYVYRGKINNASQGTRLHSIYGKSVTLSALGGGAGAKTGLYAIPIDKHGNEKTKSNTLRVSGRSSGIDDRHNWDAIRVVNQDDVIIRRLTPLECERLQCVPEGYTLGVSDSQRYKALGNAFNADVIAHILSFMPEVAL